MPGVLMHDLDSYTLWLDLDVFMSRLPPGDVRVYISAQRGIHDALFVH